MKWWHNEGKKDKISGSRKRDIEIAKRYWNEWKGKR